MALPLHKQPWDGSDSSAMYGPPEGKRPCPASRFRVIVPFIGQNALSIALGIVELPTLKRPKKRHQPKPAQPKRHRNEECDDLHQRSLSAFSVTEIELADIASAAISGVAKPASAKGTAMVL